MKLNLINIWLFFLPVLLIAQQEFHVFPQDHKASPGRSSGNGSLDKPWDLQTALNLSTEIVNGGDTIWLHEGVYNGRFVSNLQSTTSKNIILTSYKKDQVVLNGNVKSKQTSVLEVRGKQVTFKNFEITFIGDFSRSQNEANFQKVDGISHISGVNCQFINLKIYNNPSSGFGSWKSTGGSIVKGCVIFNNGYLSGKKGNGVGMYIQNESHKTKLIENNTIFNNYYKGIQVWSANKNATSEYVKNIILKNNVVFNSGLPSGQSKDNLIIATDDRNGFNKAKNISVIDNVFYHNTIIKKNQINGDAASLTLGFNSKAPVENITVENNIIIGRNNALRIIHANTLRFKNNKMYCGYVHIGTSILENAANWTFDKNVYYTKNATPFRVIKHKDYKLKDWQNKFKFDTKSDWKHLKEFNMSNVLDITNIEDSKNTFRVTLFDKEGKDVVVDFSDYDVTSNYSIKNIATGEVIGKGTLNKNKQVVFPMGTYNKTNANFGVYSIEFHTKKKRDNAFKRFFKWLF